MWALIALSRKLGNYLKVACKITFISDHILCFGFGSSGTLEQVYPLDPGVRGSRLRNTIRTGDQQQRCRFLYRGLSVELMIELMTSVSSTGSFTT